VALWHPLYTRSCRLCIKYDFKADGDVRKDEKGNPRLRPLGVPTPCLSCPKVPVEVREQDLPDSEMRKFANELTDYNRVAWDFYNECKAVGRFPDDPIVRWYAGIIRQVEDAHARYLAEKNATAIAAMITIAGMKYRG
jgi:hypothetical protein